MDVPNAVPNVMELLASHVPITLLVDLLGGEPVSSRSILRAERADVTWIPAPQPQRVAH